MYLCLWREVKEVNAWRFSKRSPFRGVRSARRSGILDHPFGFQTRSLSKRPSWQSRRIRLKKKSNIEGFNRQTMYDSYTLSYNENHLILRRCNARQRAKKIIKFGTYPYHSPICRSDDLSCRYLRAYLHRPSSAVARCASAASRTHVSARTACTSGRPSRRRAAFGSKRPGDCLSPEAPHYYHIVAAHNHSKVLCSSRPLCKSLRNGTRLMRTVLVG